MIVDCAPASLLPSNRQVSQAIERTAKNTPRMTGAKAVEVPNTIDTPSSPSGNSQAAT